MVRSRVAGLRKVVVVGQGYVGLPLAMRAVEVGHTVVGYDTNESRVKRLSAGESYVEDVRRRPWPRRWRPAGTRRLTRRRRAPASTWR